MLPSTKKQVELEMFFFGKLRPNLGKLKIGCILSAPHHLPSK
jgi:hypothetical protein